ncbi:unnamed protein product, partial [Sphacelaria rigidula]
MHFVPNLQLFTREKCRGKMTIQDGLSRPVVSQGEALPPRAAPCRPVLSRAAPTYFQLIFHVPSFSGAKENVPVPSRPGTLYFMCFFVFRVDPLFSLLLRWMSLLNLTAIVWV